jgi:hypothetical protein
VAEEERVKFGDVNGLLSFARGRRRPVGRGASAIVDSGARLCADDSHLREVNGTTEARERLARLPHARERPHALMHMRLYADHVGQRVRVAQLGEERDVSRPRLVVIINKCLVRAGTRSACPRERRAHDVRRAIAFDPMPHAVVEARGCVRLVDHVPNADESLVARDQILDAMMEERHDNVGIVRGPARIDFLPDERVTLRLYVVRRAPARHRFEPRVIGAAFGALELAPVEWERRVVEERREPLLIRKLCGRRVARVEAEDVRAEEECVARLLDTDARILDRTASAVNDADDERAHPVALDALVRALEYARVRIVSRRFHVLRDRVRHVRREQREAERERANEAAERFHLCTEKRWIVVERTRPPGRRTAEEKSVLFDESGKCCVSRPLYKSHSRVENSLVVPHKNLRRARTGLRTSRRETLPKEHSG